MKLYQTYIVTFDILIFQILNRSKKPIQNTWSLHKKEKIEKSLNHKKVFKQKFHSSNTILVMPHPDMNQPSRNKI